jgi:TonB family protein
MVVGIALMPRTVASPEWDHSKAGDGLFLLDFDSSGHVTAVHIVKSTGKAKLDAATIAKLKRWTCRPGKYEHIYVPVHPEESTPRR